ncbi:MAG: recombination protein RecR [Spirochaetales bacterium]|nr:recombination protein RecR [Spirochaetales bacterium]
MYFEALDNLISELSTLPGIGKRSAMRIALFLARAEPFRTESLSRALLTLQEKIRFCDVCGSLAEDHLCTVCRDPRRNRDLLCVVEEPGDVLAIERTAEFSGLYHVLMGALSPLDGIGPEDLRLSELIERMGSGHFQEVFLATNPNLEGDATAHYVQQLLAPYQVRVTRLQHGIPTGSMLEFADSNTLAHSIRARHNL